MDLEHDIPGPGAIAVESADEKFLPQVLLVDDSRQIRETVTWLLRDCGYRALAAEDGAVAKLLLETEHVVLIITDLEMPVCDGWELLTFSHKQYHDIPVLIISGNALGARPEIECWASGFLRKPFNFDQFRLEIQRLVSRAAPQPGLHFVS